MSNLVFAFNNQAVVSSRTVAEHFGKEHKHVLASIKEIMKAENSALTFYEEHKYKVKGNYRSYPEYYMNRDGFMLLVMGFTTKPAMQVKIAFIKAFNDMEAKLKNKALKSNAPRIEAYKDTIQRLVNENHKMRAKLDKIKPFAKMGISVTLMGKDEKINEYAYHFIQGMISNE